jgi:hypothetical protein
MLTELWLLYAAQVLLAPVVGGAIIAAGRWGARRTVLALSVGALVLLVGGVVYYDVLTGLHSQTAYILTHQKEIVAQGYVTTARALVLTGAGTTLSVGAGVLALWKTARIRRWGWFTVILAMQLAAGVVASAFTGGLPLGIINRELADVANRLARGDPGVSTPYFLVASALLLVIPVATLLYGLVGPTQEAVE